MKITKTQRIEQLPANTVITTQELKLCGFTGQDITRAHQQGILVNCGYGMWGRKVPYYLYENLKCLQKGTGSFHIGGRTILYLFCNAPKPQSIQIFDHRETVKYPNLMCMFHNLQVFNCHIFRNERCGIVERDGLYWSTPARAFFESIAGIKGLEDCRNIIRAMEQHAELEMNELMCIIGCCHSEKVKRWFFYFASKVQQNWARTCISPSVLRQALSHSSYALATPGTYISAFRITVPEELESEFLCGIRSEHFAKKTED